MTICQLMKHTVLGLSSTNTQSLPQDYNYETWAFDVPFWSSATVISSRWGGHMFRGSEKGNVSHSDVRVRPYPTLSEILTNRLKPSGDLSRSLSAMFWQKSLALVLDSTSKACGTKQCSLAPALAFSEVQPHVKLKKASAPMPAMHATVPVVIKLWTRGTLRHGAVPQASPTPPPVNPNSYVTRFSLSRKSNSSVNKAIESA